MPSHVIFPYFESMCCDDSTEAFFEYEEEDYHNDLQLTDSDGALSDDTTQYIQAATPLVFTATSNPIFVTFSMSIKT